MHLKNQVFTRKKALIIVLLCAALILGFLFIRWQGEKSDNLKTPEGRKSFLQNLGWNVDIGSENEKRVKIPDSFEGVMEDYNKMQQEQGLDLSLYSGKECTQYTYSLLNYPEQKENVYLSIYVLDNKLIAGDIHTNSVNGFMQGILPSSQ